MVRGAETLVLGRLRLHLLCSWFDSRMGDPVLVQDFIFLFLMIIKGMRRRWEFKIFLRDPRNKKSFLRSSTSCSKNVLWEWEVGAVLRSRVRGIFNSRLI